MSSTSTWFGGPLELREAGDGRTVAGIAVPYGVIAEATPVGPERFAAHAFRRSIGQRKGIVKLFRSHDHAVPIAVAQIVDSAEGVHIEARLADTPRGDEAVAEVRAGLLDSFSVGFRAIRERTVGGVREVLEAALGEVSLVALPAYPGARVLSVRSAGADLFDLPPRPVVTEREIVIGGVRWS
jgi:HK97 family phage prohead protease